MVPFQDIESSIEIGTMNAHRRIVEISRAAALTPEDVLDNERAVHTLLAVRKGELEYLKGKVPPKPPASPDEVRAAINAEAPKPQPETQAAP